MSRDLIRMMQTLFPCTTSGERETAWQPSVDIYRTHRGWLLKFDLAGVLPEEVSVRVRGCRVIVRGIRRDWVLEEGCSYYRMEIAYDEFERSVELPCNVGQAHVATDYRHGMLLVHIETEADK